MLSFIAQAGSTTTVVDFTNDLSSLLVGLIALAAFSAGMILMEAIRYRSAQRTESATEMPSATITYQQAA
jgi:hypothetical protein